MSLPGLLVNAVTVRVATYANVRGVRTPTYAETATAASVQPMKADRVHLNGLEAGQTGYTLYFAADPGVKTSDLIAWGAKTLRVLGPGEDMAGRGVCWRVDAALVT